jgi:hypothetical protein
MPLPSPEPGLVICYAYLWRAEQAAGREEGVKDRPCAIILAVRDDDGDTIVTVAPITHLPPDAPDEAVEIPRTTKQRLGLDSERSWVVVTELNRFAWPGPDLRPVSRDQPDRFDFGFLPPDFFDQVKRRLTTIAAARRLRATARTR